MYTVAVSAVRIHFVCVQPASAQPSFHLFNQKCSDISESCRLCEGLPKSDDVTSVATEPIGNPSANPTTIVHYTVPKAIQVEQPNFQMTLSHRSAACEVFIDADYKEELCKPCESSQNATHRAARRISEVSATPAKPKAEKLQANVKRTRLQVNDLADHVQQLQQKIEQHGIGISKGLEKDISKIMRGQNFEARPHMKFFWQEQMKLM